MNSEKEALLSKTYDQLLDKALIKSDHTALNDIVDEELMAFGTTMDEIIYSLSDIREIIIRQKEQSEGLSFESRINPLKRYISPDENTAIFMDEVSLILSADSHKFDVSIRMSIVLIYKTDKWKVVHFHASKPEQIKSEEDTWGIEGWKAKNAELEKLVREKTAELQKSLEELKATQSQLIQSEKMASLGELTAGIAHEIQNPMNFVNNFSEVSIELIQELSDERNKENGQRDYGLEDEILSDISQNLEKIHHHGKRADAIVKGMLQHSRASSNEKEPVDINALCDEYLRLSYHGLRAKDKSFNATLKTDFDESVGKISIVPQDIGRVIMNLLTNAFYAVTEKKLRASEESLKYEPTVSISTRKIDGGFEISVSDNGGGVPKTVAGKIFQPFFTTKPTGKGTGLGLSMSYDIITKGHGGSLTMETRVKEDDPGNTGTTFIITLPA